MERERADDEWDDIVTRLGEDLFDGVPDIIATAPPAQPAPAVTEASDHVEDWGWPDESERFIPPSPTLPRVSRRTQVAWALVGGGLLLLITSSVFAFTDTWTTLIGTGSVLAGAVGLFTRMSNEPPDDDDGAVV